MEEWRDCEELKPKPKEKWTHVDKKGEGKKHRTEWSAAANKYNCMRCGRSSNNVNMKGTCEGPKWLGKDSNHKFKRWGKAHLGGHFMLRRVDRHGEALIWCRKSSGDARCRLGPKLMSRCRPEKMDTRGYGKMLKRIVKLEEGRVPDRNAKGWNIEGENTRFTRKECERLREEFDIRGFMAQKGWWNIATKRMLDDRGALPEEAED